MRESYPTEWQTKWKEELKTDTYGNSSTDKEAVDFLTTEALKEAAFARYNATEINTTSWVKSDLGLRAESNIIYTDENDKEQKIIAGTQLLSAFFNDNYAEPTNLNPTTPTSEVNISVYQSKSYVPEKRNASSLLPELYNKYYKAANISSFLIPFVQNSENSELDLVVTPELLIKLFTASRVQLGSIIMPFTSISKFKGASTSLDVDSQAQQVQLSTDKTILNILSSEPSPDPENGTRAPVTTGSNLGSSKVTSLATLIKSGDEGETVESRAFNIAAISANESPSAINNGLFKIQKYNPITKFLNQILKTDTTTDTTTTAIKLLINYIKSFFKPDNTIDEALIEAETISKFNKQVIKLVQKIPSVDFTNFFSGLLNKSFAETPPLNAAPNKKWMVYELTPGTLLYVDAKGLKVYNIQKLYGPGSSTIVKKMLKSDIQNTIDVIDNPDKVVLFDVVTEYNKIATPDIINLEEMKDKIYDDELNAEYPVTPPITNRTELVRQYLEKNINNIISPEVTNAMSGISLYLEEIIKPMNSYDFVETTSATNGMILIHFDNGAAYTNGTLVGQQLIDSEFYDKLKEIITVNIETSRGLK